MNRLKNLKIEETRYIENFDNCFVKESKFSNRTICKKSNVNKQIVHKKAQEEIVGFVLIILIVSVILLVFLGIFLRKDTSKTGNPEVSQFLEAISGTTTECSLNGGYSFVKYSELVAGCKEGKICSSGGACDVLKNVTKNLIESSWSFSAANGPRTGYKFEAFFLADNNGVKQPLPNFPLGVVSGCSSFIGDEKTFPVTDGSLTIQLDLCLD